MWNKSQIYKIYRTRIQKYYTTFNQNIQMLQKNPLKTANIESLLNNRNSSTG